MARQGRHTKLTSDLQSRLCTLLSAGNYLAVACAQVGSGERTAYEWVARGTGQSARSTQAVFVQFAQAVEKAQAESEIAHLAVITEAGRGGAVLKVRRYVTADGEPVEEEERARPQWQAAAWFLER